MGCRQWPLFLLRDWSSPRRIWCRRPGPRRWWSGLAIRLLDFFGQSDSVDGGYPGTIRGTVASRLFAGPRRLGNQARAALPGEIAPHPLPLDAKPVLQLGQEE